MAFVFHPWLVTISLPCWGKLCHFPPESKTRLGNGQLVRRRFTIDNQFDLSRCIISHV